MADNFEHCLAITLKWEGGYSNHPNDPGGPTMRGIIQREYDTWRLKHGKRKRPVRQIEEGELRSIYREEYWDAVGCGTLPAGMDLCAFDAAVNSGVERARRWLASAQDIDAFCNARLDFLRGLGRLWRVFGTGWARRVDGIRHEAKRLAGVPAAPTPAEDATLHAGMRGSAVTELQQRLRQHGYPCGAVDGVFGGQLYRAVVLFQHDHDLIGEPGVWYEEYNAKLERADHILPKRASTTVKDLAQAGDSTTLHMNLLQRTFAWIFGASAAAQAFGGDNVIDSLNGVRNALEPAQALWLWVSQNRLLLIGAGCVGLIALIRSIRHAHLEAYRNFDYQGPAKAAEDLR
jgi:lysozyme family protein